MITHTPPPFSLLSLFLRQRYFCATAPFRITRRLFSRQPAMVLRRRFTRFFFSAFFCRTPYFASAPFINASFYVYFQRIYRYSSDCIIEKYEITLRTQQVTHSRSEISARNKQSRRMSQQSIEY